MRMMTKSSRDCKPEVGGEPERSGGKAGHGVSKGEIDKIVIRRRS